MIRKLYSWARHEKRHGRDYDAIDAIMMQSYESLRPVVEEKLSAIYPP
jgi:hypothetical protein